MSVIVFGCFGFIGLSLVQELLKQDNHVIGVFNSKSINDLHLEKSENLSLCNYSSINNFIKSQADDITLCYDLAWSGTSGDSRSDLDLQLINVKNRLEILKLCSKHDWRYIGSGSVMEKESVISTFNDMSHPLYSNNYSHLKYLSHALTKSMATELNVDYIWGRITNSYGPGENSKRLICSTMKTIANGQTPSFSSGNQLYDFIHISDLVKAFIAIGRKGISNSDYVLGSGSPRLLKEYLNIVNQLCAPHMSFNYGSEPDISKKLSLNDYDTSKLKRDTGFVCSTSFENGIRETYKYYINSFKTNL